VHIKLIVIDGGRVKRSDLTVSYPRELTGCEAVTAR
jgi:hypothetical protein